MNCFKKILKSEVRRRFLQKKHVPSQIRDEVTHMEMNVADKNEGSEDSIVVCEYCNKKIRSKDKDEHLYAEHGCLSSTT